MTKKKLKKKIKLLCKNANKKEGKKELFMKKKGCERGYSS